MVYHGGIGERERENSRAGVVNLTGLNLGESGLAAAAPECFRWVYA
jgi:hypothetical protein